MKLTKSKLIFLSATAIAVLSVSTLYGQEKPKKVPKDKKGSEECAKCDTDFNTRTTACEKLKGPGFDACLADATAVYVACTAAHCK